MVSVRISQRGVLISFAGYKFFHADTGKGLGASHQTGWTGLVAWMIFQTGSSARLPRTPRTPRSAAEHYFAETIPPTPSGSEFGQHELTEGSEAHGGASASQQSGAELSPDEVRFEFYLVFENVDKRC